MCLKQACQSDELQKSLFAEFMIQAPIQPATNYWRAIEIDEVIRYGLPKGRGLDLGCGDGHLMSIILAHVGHRNLIGLDIDPQEAALAESRSVYSEVVTAPANRLPFPEATFDFVFSNSVLEHVEEIDSALGEVARVLRPGGRLLFTVPGPDFHRCLKGPLFGNRDVYLRNTDARCAHLRYWGFTEWVQHLKIAGLKMIHEHSYLEMAQVQRWETIARHTSGILYSFFNRRRQPIEIQRMVRIRTPRLRMPRFLAESCAHCLAVRNVRHDPLYGCLLVEAGKTGSISSDSLGRNLCEDRKSTRIQGCSEREE